MQPTESFLNFAPAKVKLDHFEEEAREEGMMDFEKEAQDICAEMGAGYPKMIARALRLAHEAGAANYREQLEELAKAERLSREAIAACHAGQFCTGCGAFYTMTGYGKPWHRPGCTYTPAPAAEEKP